MHLVYVTAALPFSFEETYIIPEIQELQRRGHRVTVIPIRRRWLAFHEGHAAVCRRPRSHLRPGDQPFSESERD